MTQTEERKVLTPEQVEQLLPEGDSINCTQQIGSACLSSDFERSGFLKMLQEAEFIEEAGPNARSLGYTLAMKHGSRLLFIQTEKPGSSLGLPKLEWQAS